MTITIIHVFQIEEDAYQEDLGFSLGTIGKSKTGRIRGPVVDSKTKARISKTLQVTLACWKHNDSVVVGLCVLC